MCRRQSWDGSIRGRCYVIRVLRSQNAPLGHQRNVWILASIFFPAVRERFILRLHTTCHFPEDVTEIAPLAWQHHGLGPQPWLSGSCYNCTFPATVCILKWATERSRKPETMAYGHLWYYLDHYWPCASDPIHQQIMKSGIGLSVPTPAGQ